MYKIVKRILDIILSLVFIILLSPVFLIISLILLVTLKREIIFKQKREGKNKETFIMYKFRTMINNNLLNDKDRITKVGRILRNTSLDELPQLFNILKGDMSIIGPRPFIVGETLPDDFIDSVRYTVRPGMTGYAQIHGKRKVSHKRKLQYDVWYAKNLSFKFDVKILVLTIFNMFQSGN